MFFLSYLANGQSVWKYRLGFFQSVSNIHLLEHRWVLDVLLLVLVNHEGSYQGETKCIPTTSKIMIHYMYLKYIPPLKIWRKLS